MAKNYHSLVFIFLFFTGIYAQTTSISDPNFEQALISLGIDTDGLNGSVETANISSVTSLNVSSKSISDLTGIEDFISLTSLYCFENELTSLDITKNTALTFLQCYFNQITSIDVTKNTALTFLNLNGNQLTSIDVSQNTLLQTLGLTTNLLTSIDISKNTALSYFQCTGNQLTTLDVSKNTALTKLYCNGNQITSLDVSNNTDLIQLYCNYNKLSVLDVSQNTLLTELAYPNNAIANIDISKNILLEKLQSDNNLLTSLDVTNNTMLKTIYCMNNEITSMDLSKNLNLELIFCYSTKITSLDLSQNTALKDLRCGNPFLESLNVKNGNNSSLINFYANASPLLKCIQVDNETAANAGEAPYTTWVKDASCIYSEDCASLNFEDELLAQGLSFYPNPAHDILTIDSKVPVTKVEIYSVFGQKIIEIYSGFKNIATDNLSTGMYVFKIYSDNGTAIKKLIKN